MIACLWLTLAAPSMACWQVAEITLTSDRDYPNPFADVEVTAEFRLGDATITRPAFWDGERTWRLRFAAPTAGQWVWTTQCNDPANPGLGARTGTLEVVPYTGDNPNYQHGQVRVSEDRRYFVRANGTPFFWLGDTHWMMADTERLDANNAPDAAPGVSQFDQLLNDRVAKGFTVYQNYFVGDSHAWWRDEAFDCIDPTRFREVLDPMLERIVERGLVIAQGIGLYITARKVPAPSLARLARYVAARYGAYPIVWFTAQEVDLPPAGGEPRTDLDNWRGAAMAYAAGNGYGQPISGHMYPGRPTVWGTEPWHTWFALQGGHTNMGPRSVADYRFYWDYQPRKPYLETEAMYEQILCGPRYADDADVRHVAWKAWLNGSYGFTYGAAAVWLFKWDAADRRGHTYNPGTWWYAGMNLPGSAQLTHLRRFFEGFDWWRLRPAFGEPDRCRFDDPEQTVLATIDDTLAVIYSYGHRLPLGELRGLPAGATCAAWWFDPRTGETYPAAERLAEVDGAWPLPARPTPEDWVLVVRQGPLPALDHAADELPAWRGNLALLATATATQTDAANGYRPAQAIDGIADHGWNGWSAWANDALTLTFDEPQTARRVVLHTKAEYEMSAWRLELQTAGGWQTIADVDDNTAVVWEQALPAEPFRALRVVCLRGPARQPEIVRINELELFGDAPADGD